MKNGIFSRILYRNKTESQNSPQWLTRLKRAYQNPSIPILFLSSNIQNDCQSEKSKTQGQSQIDELEQRLSKIEDILFLEV